MALRSVFPFSIAPHVLTPSSAYFYLIDVLRAMDVLGLIDAMAALFGSLVRSRRRRLVWNREGGDEIVRHE